MTDSSLPRRQVSDRLAGDDDLTPISFHCPICNVAFPEREALDRHLDAAAKREASGGPHLPIYVDWHPT